MASGNPTQKKSRATPLTRLTRQPSQTTIPIPPSLLDKPHLTELTLPPVSSSSSNSSSRRGSSSHPLHHHLSATAASSIASSRPVTNPGYGGFMAGEKEEAWLGDTIPAAYDTGEHKPATPRNRQLIPKPAPASNSPAK